MSPEKTGEAPSENDEDRSQSPQLYEMPKGMVWKGREPEKGDNGLPKREWPVWVEYYSPVLQKNMTGEFTFRKLTPFLIAKVGARRAQYNEGVPRDSIDSVADMFSMWYAHYDYCITKSPDWWNPKDEIDDELLRGIYLKIMEYEDFFRASMERQRENYTEPGEGERSTPMAPKVVGKEVQATANVG